MFNNYFSFIVFIIIHFLSHGFEVALASKLKIYNNASEWDVDPDTKEQRKTEAIWGYNFKKSFRI